MQTVGTQQDYQTTQTEFWVKFNANDTIIEIYNPMGSLVYKGFIEKAKFVLNTSDYKNGIYFYRISYSNHKTESGKFIINHGG